MLSSRLSALVLSAFLVLGATLAEFDVSEMRLQLENEKATDKKCALKCTLDSIGVYWACAGACIAKDADPKCITVGCLAASKSRVHTFPRTITRTKLFRTNCNPIPNRPSCGVRHPLPSRLQQDQYKHHLNAMSTGKKGNTLFKNQKSPVFLASADEQKRGRDPVPVCRPAALLELCCALR